MKFSAAISNLALSGFFLAAALRLDDMDGGPDKESGPNDPKEVGESSEMGVQEPNHAALYSAKPESISKLMLDAQEKDTSPSSEKCMATILDLAAFSVETQIDVVRSYCMLRHHFSDGMCGDIVEKIGAGVNEVVAAQLCNEDETEQPRATVKASLLQRAATFIEAEHLVVNKERCTKLFEKLDRDKDGILQRYEILPHGSDGKEVPLLRFMVLADQNKDGQVTKEECTQMGVDLMASYHVVNSSESLIQDDAETSQAVDDTLRRKGGGCTKKTYACYPIHLNSRGGKRTGGGLYYSGFPGGRRNLDGPNWRAWGGTGQVYVGGITTQWYNGAGWEGHKNHTASQNPIISNKQTLWCLQWHSCDAPPKKHDVFNAGHMDEGFGNDRVSDIDMYCGPNTGVWYGTWHENMNCAGGPGGNAQMKRLGKVGEGIAGGWLGLTPSSYDAYTTANQFDGPTTAQRVIAWLSLGKQIAGLVRR